MVANRNFYKVVSTQSFGAANTLKKKTRSAESRMRG